MKIVFGVIAALLTCAAMAYLAAVGLSNESSLYLSIATVLAMVLLGAIPGPVARLTFLVLGGWIAVRYLFWRFTSLPLSGADLFSSFGAILVLAAECYGVLMLILGMLINISPLSRKPIPLPEDRSSWPTVDVYIPTYSEDLDVVKPTMLGALNIDYPSDKIKVYVLDDGYPRSKTSKNQDALNLAKRSELLREMCAQYGAHYITRDNNFHAKSGNMNNAMLHTDGELILILDADHVPTCDILNNTVGFFFKDSKLAFVQTPHFFINPDPVEKNLNLFNQMPAENDMFYQVVQKGLDLWNTAFFCGSAAVIRRVALDDVGGFSVDSITEDASTSVKMHAKKWNSAYLDIPMVGGLQPESFDGFVVQRMRWAMGMVQIFMKQNPLWVSGLSFGQRIGYLSVISFWFFPFSRTVFFVAPCAALFFNLKLYPFGDQFLFSYTFPYLIVVVMVFEKLFGKVRRFLTSELYETLQGFYGFPSIIGAALNPNKPSFKVTPKGERHDIEHISSMVKPFYVVYFFTVISLALAIYRLTTEPESRLALLLTTTWLTFNFVLLNAALGVLVEKVQIRSRPRIPFDEQVTILLKDGRKELGVMVDANENGGLFHIPTLNFIEEFWLVTPTGILLKVLPLRDRWMATKPSLHPSAFAPENYDAEMALNKLVYGSSSRWNQIWRGRAKHQNPLLTLLSFAILGLNYVQRHLSRRLEGNN